MDKDKLIDEMKKREITIGRMCQLLKMSRTAFYRKCKGISEFKHSEIQAIVDILNLDTPDGIFFNAKVS